MKKHLKIMRCYFRMNLSSALEYRTSFFVQAFGMALSNSSFIFFWWIAFSHVGGQIAGYSFEDVMFIWAAASSGFGLAHILFANAASLTQIIVTSELDAFLLQPCNVLLNVICAKTNLSAYGDFMYGIILMGIVYQGNGAAWLWYAVSVVTGCILITAILLLANSFTFYIGDASAPSRIVTELTINMSIYPDKIYGPPVRALMYSLIPVGFAVHVPMRLLNGDPPILAAAAFAGSVLFCVAAAHVFYRGLKRYESGNIIVTRL
ncbi:MAG: ABC-2 family transporter protein [Oscillospiraceae bacterium]|nr:ABC-2 family transporter protein [Oscillospiraceae bacterium]